MVGRLYSILLTARHLTMKKENTQNKSQMPIDVLRRILTRFVVGTLPYPEKEIVHFRIKDFVHHERFSPYVAFRKEGEPKKKSDDFFLVHEVLGKLTKQQTLSGAIVSAKVQLLEKQAD